MTDFRIVSNTNGLLAPSTMILPTSSSNSITGNLTFNELTNNLNIQNADGTISGTYLINSILSLNNVNANAPDANCNFAVNVVPNSNVINFSSTTSPGVLNLTLNIGRNLCMTSTNQSINGLKIFNDQIQANGLNMANITNNGNICANSLFTLSGINNIFSGSISVDSSPAPTFGQMLTINSPTTAIWQNGQANNNLSITSLNGLNASSQTFLTGTTGTDFNVVSVGSTHTFNMPDASVTAIGLINTGAQTFGGNKTFSPQFNSVLNSNIKMANAKSLRTASGAVTVSGSYPTINQVLTASSSTTASWQNPTFGLRTFLDTTTGSINSSVGLAGSANFALIQTTPTSAEWQLPVANSMWSVTGQDWFQQIGFPGGNLGYTGNVSLPISTMGNYTTVYASDPFNLMTLSPPFSQCLITPGTGPVNRTIQIEFSSSIVSSTLPLDINARYQIELWVASTSIAVLCVINGNELFDNSNNIYRVPLNGFSIFNYNLFGLSVFQIYFVVSGSDNQFHNFQFSDVNVKYTILGE